MLLDLLLNGLANVLTNAGRDILTNRIKGAGTEPNFIGWGTGGGTAAVGDTTLFTEARSQANSGGNAIRVTGTSTRETTSVTNDTYRVVGTVTSEASRTITNAGLFDTDGAVVLPGPPAGGNLFIKGDFTGIALVNGDSIQFTFNLQFN